MYDVVVLGSGPAGVSAAIFCARANVKTIVLGRMDKSQLVLAHTVENYFGFAQGIKGSDLLANGVAQAKKFGAEFLKQDAVSASQDGETFLVTTEKNKKIETKALIIATGIPITSLGIKNEQSFVGKGLSYCVTCDGPLFKDKNVCVIGNSNRAADEAIELLHYTKKVTIVSNDSGFDFSKEFEDEIRKRNIGLLEKKITEFSGKPFLSELVFSDSTKMPFDGAFIACGAGSGLDFCRELGVLTQNNSIIVDERNMTNLAGVFAAGNCVGRCRQVAANVGDGANAAINAIKFVGSRKLYLDYATK